MLKIGSLVTTLQMGCQFEASLGVIFSYLMLDKFFTFMDKTEK